MFGDISTNIIFYKFGQSWASLTGTFPIIIFFSGRRELYSYGLFSTAHNIFFSNTYFQNSFISPFQTKTWVEMKLQKVAYLNSFPHFSLSSMYEVVGEAVLLNIFSKTVQLHLKSCLWSCFQKNSFTSEVELCQTSPKFSDM